MNDLTQFLLGHGGTVLFAVVFVEQAGLPLPAAPWLLAAGALSAAGSLNPVLAIGVTAVAAVLADSLWFYVGRRGGQRVLRFFCRLSLARNSCVGRTNGLFAQHGLQALVAAKFLPGLGTVMPPLAGALGMKTSRFLLFDGLGSLFYGTFYVAAGFIFRNQLELGIAMLKELGFSALLLLLILLAGYIVFKYARRESPASKEIRNEKPQNRKPELVEQELDAELAPAQQSIVELPRRMTAVELPTVTLALTTSASQCTGVGTSVPLVPHPIDL
jgi:membrane protein DedA with SNARE-associated domain